MKSKHWLIRISIMSLFLLVNIIEVWKYKLGFLFFFVVAFSLIYYLVLVFVGVYQVGLSVHEQFKNPRRNWTLGILVLGLVLIYIKPTGFIDFDKNTKKQVLVAHYESSASCGYRFSCFADSTYEYKSFCYKADKVTGRYTFKDNILLLKTENQSSPDIEVYDYAEIGKSKRNRFIKKNVFICYTKQDTLGFDMNIIELDSLFFNFDEIKE